jgi:hypothetical protein
MPANKVRSILCCKDELIPILIAKPQQVFALASLLRGIQGSVS